MMKDEQHVFARVLLALVCLALYLNIYWAFINKGEFYSHLDIKAQFVPWRCFYSLALERGELGLWNPFLSRGYPHHAEGQTGVFHPAHIIAYKLLPVEMAAGLEMALYIPFAFLGMLLFLRRSFRFDWLACMFGAALFGFSVFFHLHFLHVNLLWVYAHLPWALLCVERAFRGGHPARWAGGLALCFASMILLGHPQMVWMNAIAVGILMLYLGWTMGKYGGTRVCECEGKNSQEVPLDFRKRLGFAGLGLLAALLIGMIQILPTADYLARSTRSTVSRNDFVNYSLHPASLLVSVSPQLFQERFVAGWVVEGGVRNYIMSPEFVTYFGLGCLSLIIWGLILFRKPLLTRKNLPGVAIIGGALLAFILLALGKYGGVIYLQWLLPLVSKFRCPVRYVALAAALLAVLAAFVLDRLIADESSEFHFKRWGNLALAAPVLLTIAVTTIVYLCGPEMNIPWLGRGLAVNSFWLIIFGPAAALLLLGLFLACLYFRSPLLLAVFCVCCLLDLELYSMPLLNMMHRRNFDDVRIARQAMREQDHRFRRYAGNNDPVWDGFYLANGYLGIEPREELIYYGKGMKKEYLYLASIEFGYFEESKTSPREAEPVLIEVPNPLPRIRLAPELKHSEKPLADVANFNLRTTALCLPGAAEELAGPPIEPEESVEFIEDGYRRLKIKVQVKHPRLLIISDRWWPHWRAWVDGEKRQIIPLYGESLRGIIVKPGDQLVSMSYCPTPLYRGYVLAIIGGLLLLALFVFDWRKSRKTA